MDESTSREKILKKVRAALINKSRQEPSPVDLESNVFESPSDSIELVFAQQFSDAGGQFVFCENEEEFAYNIGALIADGSFGKIWCAEKECQELLSQAGLKFLSKEKDIASAQTSLTGCEFLIARTGSALVSSRQASGRKGHVFPDSHIIVAKTSQLVMHVKDALREMRNRYPSGLPGMLTMITGPSRTADIEKTLVQGVHGPKEIYVFLIDDVPQENVQE
ncbi:MAG TPA: LUD domain-containing protein [Bacteroidia bacterium]|nr:LUD domain-containing protein [Bacteroidia bacterium]